MRILVWFIYFTCFTALDLIAMSFKGVGKRNCVVLGCTNSWYSLEKWMRNICEIHSVNYGTGCCVCDPPFKLIPFPTERKDPDARKIWASVVNRKNWVPATCSRICSDHFVDGEPTHNNPYPSLNLGYTPIRPIKARPAPKERCDVTPVIPVKRAKVQLFTQEAEPDDEASCKSLHPSKQPDSEPPSTTDHVGIKMPRDHDYSVASDVTTGTCTISDTEDDDDKDRLIRNLQQKVKTLQLEKMHLMNQMNKNTKSISLKLSCILKNDKKVKFYTGFPTLQSFNDIFKVLESKVKHMKHWKGPSRVCNPLNYKRVVSKSRKLSLKHEFVLTMMKLRLGLLLEDLADRFGISTTNASNIFTTWVKVLSQTLGTLVFNPPKHVVKSNLPPSFQNRKFCDVRHIVDCSEVFLEKPSNLGIAARTWSDYKHHNTGKFLVSINPSGMINFVSECWGGRASDKLITNQSGFLDIIEPYDSVLADRGFPIREELTLKRATLLIPPGRRGVSQMSTADVQLTKNIANRRIYVEQAIRRMKCFRILKYEISISLMHHLDDIVKTVAGICNLYPPLPCYNDKT